MAPTVNPGDFVAVLPTAAFRGDALYVVDMLGIACIVRMQHLSKGQLRLRYDNPAYQGGSISVAAVCRVTDLRAAEEARLVVMPPSHHLR